MGATACARRISSDVASLIPKYLTFPSFCNLAISFQVSSIGMVRSTLKAS